MKIKNKNDLLELVFNLHLLDAAFEDSNLESNEEKFENSNLESKEDKMENSFNKKIMEDIRLALMHVDKNFENFIEEREITIHSLREVIQGVDFWENTFSRGIQLFRWSESTDKEEKEFLELLPKVLWLREELEARERKVRDFLLLPPAEDEEKKQLFNQLIEQEDYQEFRRLRWGTNEAFQVQIWEMRRSQEIFAKAERTLAVIPRLQS